MLENYVDHTALREENKLEKSRRSTQVNPISGRISDIVSAEIQFKEIDQELQRPIRSSQLLSAEASMQE